MEPLRPDPLLKAPPLNTIAMAVKFQREFWKAPALEIIA